MRSPPWPPSRRSWRGSGRGLSGDLDSTRDALERERTAAAVLADPSARSVAVTGAQGRLVVADDGRAVLVLDELQNAPAGKTYEVWVIDDDTPVPAGLFPGAESPTTVPVEGSVTGGSVVAVTVERRGRRRRTDEHAGRRFRPCVRTVRFATWGADPGRTLVRVDLHGPLQELFGFDDFRPGQEEVVRAAIGGRDTLAIMPTGSGKSLTYQLAAALRPTPTLVLSPLISNTWPCPWPSSFVGPCSTRDRSE